MNGRHTASSDRVNEYPEYKDEFDEDPARFLESNELMATARIAGIRDPDLLDAYETVAEDITAGSYRTTILEAIADRKTSLGLTDELAGPTNHEATADPIPATDGGTELEYDEAEDVDQPDEPEPEQIHPDARGLEAGEVLVVDRGEKVEYVFPTTSKVDFPYISRAYEADTDKLWMGLEIDEEDYRSRLSKDPDHRSFDEIDVDVPRTAATGGDT